MISKLFKVEMSKLNNLKYKHQEKKNTHVIENKLENLYSPYRHVMMIDINSTTIILK
jgi:hypothetical protein